MNIIYWCCPVSSVIVFATVLIVVQVKQSYADKLEGHKRSVETEAKTIKQEIKRLQDAIGA
jgi:cytochrome c-type biogenesis protein CcmH/NrfF